MTLQEIISTINELEPNTYSNERLTSFINEVETVIKERVDHPTNFHEMKRLKDQSEYDLPSTILFDNIVTVMINGTVISKVDFTHDESLPGYRLSNNGKFEIFPVVSSDQKSNDIKIIFTPTNEDLDYNTDKDISLTASPYDELYYTYGMSQVNFYNKDYAASNNLIDRHNDILEEFLAQNIRKGATKPKVNRLKNIW